MNIEELKQWKTENDPQSFNLLWGDYDSPNYEIVRGRDNKLLVIPRAYESATPLLFSDKEKAQKCLDTFGEKLNDIYKNN